jgi:hypothetical protein
MHRYDFDLPEDLPEGDYRVGFLLLDSKTGEVIRPVTADRVDGDIDGAFFFDEAPVTIITRDEAREHYDADLGRAYELWADSRCEDGWEAWRQARYHLWKNRALVDEQRPLSWEQMAICHAKRAEAAQDQKMEVDNLLIAMRWDHRPDEVTDQARPLAQEFDKRGDEVAAKGDAQGAYELYNTALKLDPRLSWTRRKAEELRDERLGIEGKERDSSSSSRSTPRKDEDEDAKKDEPSENEGDEGDENEGDENEGDEGDEDGPDEGNEDVPARGDAPPEPTRRPPPPIHKFQPKKKIKPGGLD